MHATVKRLGFVVLVLVGGTLLAGVPMDHEEAQLTASDAASDDLFGIAVALDGDTALVGAYLDDHSGGEDAGSAYVYVDGGAGWTEQAKLTVNLAEPDAWFGASTAISGDTALVGAFRSSLGGAPDSGSAHVYVRNGTNWTEQFILTAGDAMAGDLFGSAVALEGETALVGARHDDHPGATQSGSAWVFVGSGTNWIAQEKLTASDAGDDDEFGFSVALEGDTAVVGAFGDSHAGGMEAGSAYVFVRDGTEWTEQAKLTANDAAPVDHFGFSVAISGDTVVVGAQLDDPSNSGSAYVFVRSGTTWTQQAKLVASDAKAAALFGGHVAVEGNTALISSTLDDHSGVTSTGSVYVFTREGTIWSEQFKLTASDAASGDIFGVVALSGDTAVVGANRDDHSGLTDAGSAYIFEDLPVVRDGEPPVPAVSDWGLITGVLLLATVSTAVLLRRRCTAA